VTTGAKRDGGGLPRPFVAPLVRRPARHHLTYSHYVRILPAMGTGIDVKTLLLAQLVRGPTYGLKMIEDLETKTKGKVGLSQGAVYMALRELETDGLVASFQGDEKLHERGGRPRRYWKLTAEGKRVATEDRAAVAGLFGLSAKVRALVAAWQPEVR
jgi:PadR family transcriptional regulator